MAQQSPISITLFGFSRNLAKKNTVSVSVSKKCKKDSFLVLSKQPIQIQEKNSIRFDSTQWHAEKFFDSIWQLNKMDECTL